MNRESEEKARSLLKLTETREKFVDKIKEDAYTNIIAENYYEIIKELSTAIALSDGIKATGKNTHKELIEFMSNYKLDLGEINLIDDLRLKRNKSLYEGKEIDSSYIKNKRNEILKIIFKLKEILKRKLG